MIRTILSLLFFLGSKLRISLYNLGIFKKIKIDARVISVGNLSLGGAGKTPMVLWLAEKLSKKKYKIGILEKGYKSGLPKNKIILAEKGTDKIDTTLIGDESSMVWDKVPQGVRLAVASKKYLSAVSLKNKWRNTDVIIIDDGFQHLKLGRDIDIVLMDPSTGFSDKIFPRGRLREPYSSLKRANVVVFTKTDGLSNDEKDELRDKALIQNPDIKIFFSKTKFFTSKDVKGKKIFPVSAIYNVDGFHKKLKEAGAVFDKFISFPDHHCFTEDDVKHMFKEIKDNGIEYIVVTSKDWTKLQKFVTDKNKIIESWYEHDVENEGDFIKCCIG